MKQSRIVRRKVNSTVRLWHAASSNVTSTVHRSDPFVIARRNYGTKHENLRSDEQRSYRVLAVGRIAAGVGIGTRAVASNYDRPRTEPAFVNETHAGRLCR